MNSLTKKLTKLCAESIMSSTVQLIGTTYTVSEDTILTPDTPFSLPSGYTFIIPQGITLTINGSFTWNGELIVNGTLINNTSIVSNKLTATTIVDGIIQNHGALKIPNLTLETSGNIVITDGAETICSGKSRLSGTMDLQGSATVKMAANSTTVVSGIINIPPSSIFTNDGDVTVAGSIIGGGTINNNSRISATSTATIKATSTGSPVSYPAKAKTTSGAPGTRAPATVKSGTAEPITAEPSTAEPSAGNSGVVESGTAEPITAEPSTAEPSAGNSGVVESGTGEHSAGEPEQTPP